MKQIPSGFFNLNENLNNTSKRKMMIISVIINIITMIIEVSMLLSIFKLLNVSISTPYIIGGITGAFTINIVKDTIKINKEHNRSKAIIKDIISEVNDKIENNITIDNLKESIKVEKELETKDNKNYIRETDYYLLDSKDKLLVLKQIANYVKKYKLNNYQYSELYLLEDNEIKEKEIPKKLINKKQGSN